MLARSSRLSARSQHIRVGRGVSLPKSASGPGAFYCLDARRRFEDAIIYVAVRETELTRLERIQDLHSTSTLIVRHGELAKRDGNR